MISLVKYSVGHIYVIAALSIFYYLHTTGMNTILVYYIASACLIVLTQFLEWTLPYEKRWNTPNHQMANEVGHTLISAGIGHNIGRAIAIGLLGTLAASWAKDGAVWWPRGLPAVLQVLIAFAAWDLGVYWSHRIMHSYAWRVHHLHHKLERLSWVNSGYGHPIQFVLTSLFDFSLLLLSGAPSEIIVFTIYLSGALNFLPHANVDMKMGPLNYILATPELHRWHHAVAPKGTMRNLGMQLIIWDIIFGTYYRPSRGDPVGPSALGSPGSQPRGFLQQWMAPFMRKTPPHWDTM